MANLVKKLERLELLKESVLKSIYDYCDLCYCGDDWSMTDTIDIIHKGEKAGEVVFWVTTEVDRLGETSFILQESDVKNVFTNNGEPMPNVTRLLNELLIAHDGDCLNY